MTIRHSGFAAIVGRPNVGKSTLLNAILGEKIAIVSPKPQTTRNRITGVYTKNDTQLVFLDTPGWHQPKTRLGGYMAKAVEDSLNDVDAVLLVIEPRDAPQPAEEELLQKLKARANVFLVINKIDTVTDKSALIGVMAAWNRLRDFTATIPISARKNSGVDTLLAELEKVMPEGPQYYPGDIVTAEPERVVVAEIIREKLLMLLSAEVPHGLAVSIERMKEREHGGLMDIDATIYCERESHTGIIVGKGGAMLKKVGTKARADIESLLGCHVNLRLWVKVKENWRNREGVLRTLGYD